MKTGLLSGSPQQKDSVGCSEVGSKKLVNKTGTAAQPKGHITGPVPENRWPVRYCASRDLRSLTCETLAPQSQGTHNKALGHALRLLGAHITVIFCFKKVNNDKDRKRALRCC